MAYSVTKQDSQESYGYKEIYVDDVSEVSEVPTNYLPGSQIIVRKGGLVYFLTSNHEWKTMDED